MAIDSDAGEGAVKLERRGVPGRGGGAWWGSGGTGGHWVSAALGRVDAVEVCAEDGECLALGDAGVCEAADNGVEGSAGFGAVFGICERAIAAREGEEV